MALALHQRTVIRRAVRDFLKGKTAAGNMVEATRRDKYRQNELPAIAIYTPADDVDEDSKDTSPRELKRDLTVRIVGRVKDSERVDDVMDALALEIENVMHADPYLGGVAGDSILRGTEVGIDDEGERPIGVITLTYSVTYRTAAPAAPELDDFNTADTKYDVGVPEEEQQAHDVVTVQEPTP